MTSSEFTVAPPAGDISGGGGGDVHGGDTAAPRNLPRRAGRPELRRPSDSLFARIGSYLLLAGLALADAVGFSRTLTVINRGEHLLWTVFTVALTIGAVWGAHVAGRMVRDRREGRDGHPAWVAVIGAAWLSLGLVVAWLRAGQAISQQPDVQSALGSVGPVGDPNAGKLAVLLLGLYLLTGVLAATTAYRYAEGSARPPMFWLRWRRDRAARRAARATHERRLAEETTGHIDAARQRARDAHDNRVDDATGEGDLLKQTVQLHIGSRIPGGPAEFDGLTQP